ncbi:hypothetical protein TNCV_1275391 [Trichonephila clavipes]|nr:hypothetical protein TNCV_1275391 [Trichonephila clavipes]
MFDEVGILYCFLFVLFCIVFFDGGRKLEHPVAKLLVVVAIGGFSDTLSAAEEKRTGKDKKVMKAEESIHCILKQLEYTLYGTTIHCIYPGVEMGHFSNSIFPTVVYEQIDSYGEVFLSLDSLGI